MFSSVFALVWILNIWIIALKKFFSLYFTFLHFFLFLFFFLLFISFMPRLLCCLVILLASLPCLVTMFNCFTLFPHYFIMLLHCLVVFCATSLPRCLSLPRCPATSHCFIASLPIATSLPSCLMLPHCLPTSLLGCHHVLYLLTSPPNLLFHYLVASCFATSFALLPCTLSWLVLPFSFFFCKEELGRASFPTPKKKVSFFFLFFFLFVFCFQIVFCFRFILFL